MAEELRGGDDDGTHYAFSVAEAIFVGWFTFEYIVRFIAAPQKFRYNLNRTPLYIVFKIPNISISDLSKQA